MESNERTRIEAMTLPDRNKQWRLASFPEGMPEEDTWTLSEGTVPEPRANQVLARAIYLDVAPYMRSRISPQKNYAAGVAVGDVMIGGGIGEVLRSNARQFKPGDIVATDHSFGWQQYSAISASALRKVDPAVAPLPYWMDALGLNGMTAYCALLECTHMKAGDTVVVSAAAGSVGQITGQIAKIGGCRVVGFTSSEEKIAWCREIGYDELINYRTESDLVGALRKACPRGVDVFIDNTAGVIHEAVMQNLATNARIALVGSISLSGKFGQPDVGQRFPRQILIARATIKGFLVSDYAQHHAEARNRIGAWLEAGLMKSKFDIAEGMENLPRAFLKLLNSENVGKQLVKVGEEPQT
jgi:NADPH-dependent curcumin reductase CurA